MANPNQVQRSRPTAVGIAPFSGWIPRKLWRKAKDFFIYSAEFLPLAAGGTLTVETAIQSDSDFLAVAGCRVVSDTANTTFFATVPQLITIVDAGSGRQLMDRAQHIDNLLGTAQLPSYFPMPKIFRANGTISTTLQNLDGANARNVRISYLGFKVFDYEAE